MSSPSPAWRVRPLEQSDLEVWTQLFRGYATFYERSLTEEQLATVWRWIFEEDRTLALVVYDAANNS